MKAIRFAAALALILSNPLFAAEPSGNAVPGGEKNTQAETVVQPPYVIQRPYRIEPPDVIQIEMLKVIPKAHRAEIFDVLQIRAKALPDQPIDNNFLVEADGTIDFGHTYGSVRVSGMTIDEIRTTLNKWLHQWIKDPSVSVQLVRVAGAQPVSGKYLVGPDGTINLHQYGVVKISGKTATEARSTIQDHLKQYLDLPELSVGLLTNNSKVYYVVETQGRGCAEDVRRVPINGIVTVLDAMGQGTSENMKIISIARPVPRTSGGKQTLPVDWDAIIQGKDMTTNYQILPGDRLYVLVWQTAGRNYNHTRNGL
jgi:polysaccharide biosynthesis/export protein